MVRQFANQTVTLPSCHFHPQNSHSHYLNKKLSYKQTETYTDRQ